MVHSFWFLYFLLITGASSRKSAHHNVTRCGMRRWGWALDDPGERRREDRSADAVGPAAYWAARQDQIHLEGKERRLETSQNVRRKKTEACGALRSHFDFLHPKYWDTVIFVKWFERNHYPEDGLIFFRRTFGMDSEERLWTVIRKKATGSFRCAGNG